MELIPAIDLLGGRVVRLHRGCYDEATVYDDDPAATARRFEQAGVQRLHVVDLDGARDGRPGHVRTIERILEHTGLQVQIGGGVREIGTVQHWIAAGADRVVLGTAAVRQPEVARAACEQHPGRIVVAIDARGGEVAVAGWREQSARHVQELAREVDGWGVAGLLYTDIDRDGTGEGPNVEATAALQSVVRATVMASGGIGSLEHLRALARGGVRAAVCGRALYDGVFTVEQAVVAAAEVG